MPAPGSISTCDSNPPFANPPYTPVTMTIYDVIVEEVIEDEDWEPWIPEEPSPILEGFHAKLQDRFWLSMVSSNH